MQLISGSYEILAHSKLTSQIARIQTVQKTWFAKSGLTVAALNPADLALVRLERFFFYNGDATALVKKFAEMVKKEQAAGHVLVGTVLDTLGKQTVALSCREIYQTVVM